MALHPEDYERKELVSSVMSLAETLTGIDGTRARPERFDLEEALEIHGEENARDAIHSLISLSVGFLNDVNRIADALERISETIKTNTQEK